jgi:hypothetical protein
MPENHVDVAFDRLAGLYGVEKEVAASRPIRGCGSGKPTPGRS